ncbi:unnamed protein product, partial [Schistosoma margrebowiei]
MELVISEHPRLRHRGPKPRSLNLLQENHSLLKKLELKKEMEAAYLDEIEQLRSVITRLQQEKSISTPRVDDNLSLLYNLESRIEKSEEKVALLTKELDLTKKREADLLEQLNSFANKVDNISECSITVLEPHNSLVEEINRLKEELSSKETSNRLEQSKLTRQIQELEDDRQNLQDYIIELDRQLKDCRLELNDTQAQLEALQIQSNSTENTRGNSVFSEVSTSRRTLPRYGHLGSDNCPHTSNSTQDHCIHNQPSSSIPIIPPTSTFNPKLPPLASSSSVTIANDSSAQNTVPGLLKPRSKLHIGAFNVRTLCQIGQQASLAKTLESLSIDVCCVSETRIQDSSVVIHLISPRQNGEPTRYTLRVSGDPMASSRGLAGVGI